MKYRRGQFGDQFFAVLFVFLMIVIGGGIVFGVSAFFGGESEFRLVEADILYSLIQHCLLHTEMNWQALQKSDEVFYSTCRLDRSVVENYSLIQIVEDGKEVFSVNKGKTVSCALTGAASNDAYPKCISHAFFIQGRRYVILTGSDQHIRREDV